MLEGFKAVRLIIPCGKAAQYFSVVNRQNSGQVLLYGRADDQRHGSFKAEKEACIGCAAHKKSKTAVLLFLHPKGVLEVVFHQCADVVFVFA